MKAILTGTVYVILNAGMGVSVISLDAGRVLRRRFGFRLTCQTLGWEEMGAVGASGAYRGREVPQEAGRGITNRTSITTEESP